MYLGLQEHINKANTEVDIKGPRSRGEDITFVCRRDSTHEPWATDLLLVPGKI